MSERLSRGPIQVVSNDVFSLNSAFMMIQNEIDEIRGLRGRATVYDRQQVEDPTEAQDAVTLGTRDAEDVLVGPGDIVKGWVKFQIDGTIDDDLNVSSITDNGVGDWTVNWATAFTDGNYGVMLTVQSAVPTLQQLSVDDDNPPTATALRIQSGADGAQADPTGNTVRIYAAAIGS